MERKRGVGREKERLRERVGRRERGNVLVKTKEIENKRIILVSTQSLSTPCDAPT